MRHPKPELAPLPITDLRDRRLDSAGLLDQKRHDPLRPKDVLPEALYRLVRARYLPQLLDIKRRRRVWLGANISVQFENRSTALYQLHELLRAGGCWSTESVHEAFGDCAPLVPGPGQLCATVIVHAGPSDWSTTVATNLSTTPGDTLFLSLGEHWFDAQPCRDDAVRGYPVQHVSFELSDRDAVMLLDPRVSAKLAIATPERLITSALSPATRVELGQDLRRGRPTHELLPR